MRGNPLGPDGRRLPKTGKNQLRRELLRRYGRGTPTEERVRHSSANAVTMIVRDHLVPFTRRDGRMALREPQPHELP
jgi:hypothetical protein